MYICCMMHLIVLTVHVCICNRCRVVFLSFYICFIYKYYNEMCPATDVFCAPIVGYTSLLHFSSLPSLCSFYRLIPTSKSFIHIIFIHNIKTRACFTLFLFKNAYIVQGHIEHYVTVCVRLYIIIKD